MLKIISAQTFELLEAHLLDQLMQPGTNPFVEDQVLIPSAAIQRRLTFSIADRYGICSRVGFSFVATWLWQQVVELLKDFPARSPFDANTLRWRIFKCFEDPQFLLAHPRLRAYLDNADATMRFDLACQVASLFDQYTTYRSDWLAAWAAGRVIATSAEAGDARADENWQSALWRSLLQDISGTLQVSLEHPSELFLQALADKSHQGGVPDKLKQTVHVFCIPSLPPLYLSWLRGLAAYRDVVLYVLDPCQEYWHDLVPARELVRLQLKGQLDYQEVGHRLLASWGRQTQAYVQLLLGQDGDTSVEVLPFQSTLSSPLPSLLTQVQAGIHTLKDLTAGSLHGRARADGSIQIHCCHSLTRELEVLHDCLLARFKQPHPPRPSDILVVVPDLDQAAPLIEGVFGHASKELRIPYMISGVAPISVSPCAQGILTILKLARSRLTMGEVIEALRLPLIADAVGIPDDEVDTLAQWLKQADVRWGFSAFHRKELNLPSTNRHSFEEGIDRLFMGYALPENTQALWQGQIPVDSVEGTEAQYLGAFADFIDKLQRLHSSLQTSLTPDQWSQTLNHILQTFIKPTADIAQEMQALVQGIIERSHEMLDAMPMDSAIAVDVLMRAFEEGLQGRAKGGVPTGAVTFAAMPSLRGLPHRFVCILGLNDQVFPSPQKHIEFDLIARSPRHGDRQRNHDERNLFLDLVLSARERLHLSYVGKDRKDNAPIPPSVVLTELIDALVPALCEPNSSADQKEQVRSALITEHALQAFSEVYFENKGSGKQHFSFRKNFAGALKERAQNMALRAHQEEDRALLYASLVEGGSEGEGEGEEANQIEQEWDRLSFGLSAPFYDSMMQEALEPEWRDVSVSQLILFFQNPVKYYLNQRLGLELPWVEREWPDTEDFEPTKKAKRALAQRLLPVLLEGGKALTELDELARAGREFPEGLGGQAALALATAQISQFAQGVQAHISAMPTPDQQHSLSFGIQELGVEQTWTLSGVTDSLFGSSRVRYHFGDWNAKEAIEIWVRHLFLCAGSDALQYWTTVWIGADDSQVLLALEPEDAKRHLQNLLELYVQGLNEPLYFFPRSAWAYTHAEGKKPGSGLKFATKEWMPSRYKPYAEGANMEYRLAFRGASMSLKGDFERLAMRVFGPFLNCLQTASSESERAI